MKGFKRFKVFYFSNDSRPHFNEPNRNWDKGTGMPCSCAPPYDTACSNFSKNHADKNKPLNAMRRLLTIIGLIETDI